MTSATYLQDPSGIWRDNNCSLTHYDAEYWQRAVAFWADPRIGIRYFVNSGSRSYAEQKALYKAYLAGGTLAAKPGTSNHEYDSPNHPVARAMDINPREGKGGSYAELHSVASEYGFHFPIPTELWHMEMRPDRGAIPNHPSPTPQPMTEDGMADALVVTYPTGAKTIATPDGAIFNAGTPFYGSLYDLPADQKQGVTSIKALTAADPNNPAAGYVAWAQNGNPYRFDAAEWKKLGH